MMSDVREIELAVEHFASNQEFIRLYNRHNRELLLQHFLLIAAAGNDVWTTNQERKMSMPEQRDLMLVKYMEWLEKLNIEFPEVEKPFDVSEDWWRLMLLAYERKPISGKSLWRKFKEDTRNPILSSFNCHWAEPREGETMDDRFRVVRRGVWSDLGHRDDEFLQEGSWLPKQWYAWRFCCYPGKNFRAFDGKLPSVPQRQRNAALMRNNSGEMSNGWGQASLPIDASMLENQGQGQNQGQGLGQGQGSSASAALPIHRGGGLGGGGASSSSSGMRPSRSTLPSTVTNQRLLQAAASMSRVRANPEDELNVQHYLADVQQYMAQMTRLEKAATLAEAFGEQDKAVGFKRQLYEHVQTEPPQRLKRPGAHSPVHQQQGPTPIPLSAHNGNGNGNGNSGHSNAHLTPNHNNHNHGNGLGHHQQNNLAIIPIPGMQIHNNSSSSGTNSLSEGSSGIHQHN